MVNDSALFISGDNISKSVISPRATSINYIKQFARVCFKANNSDLALFIIN